MKPIPTAPTDNLYKFMAVSGIWMLVGLLALFSWFIYLEFEIKDHSAASRSYFSSLRALEEIESRLGSIESGNVTENKLDWVPEEWDIKQEKHVLEIAKENHSASIAKNQYAANSKAGEELRYLSHPVVIFGGIVYIFLMVFFIYIGFKRWKTRIHDPDLYFKSKNTELVEKSIEKLSLEISLLREELRESLDV